MRKKGSPTKEKYIDLAAPEGNAFNILAYAKKLTNQLKDTNPEIYDWKRISDEMTASNYENLVNTFEHYFGDYITIYDSSENNE